LGFSPGFFAIAKKAVKHFFVFHKRNLLAFVFKANQLQGKRLLITLSLVYPENQGV